MIVVNIKDSPDIAVDISDCVDCPADAVLTSSCVYFGAAIITNMVDLDVFFLNMFLVCSGSPTNIANLYIVTC